MANKNVSYKAFEQKMFKDNTKMYCITSAKEGGIRISATCYNVMTLAPVAVWLKGKGIVWECS